MFVGDQQQPRGQLFGTAEIVLEGAGQRIRFQGDQPLIPHRFPAIARRVLDGDREHCLGAEFAQVARNLAVFGELSDPAQGARSRAFGEERAQRAVAAQLH